MAMTKARIDGLKSVLRLLRFLFWYAVVVGAVVYLLPWAGRILESGYEAMSGSARVFTVVGFFAVAAAWQLTGMRGRARRSGDPGRDGRGRFS